MIADFRASNLRLIGDHIPETWESGCSALGSHQSVASVISE